MKTMIYCRPTAQGIHSFYILTGDSEFFLFNQNYRKGVHSYFSKGVRLDEACDYSKANRDSAVIKTMNKLPTYIKYIEREYGITILNQTKKRNQTLHYKERLCA